MLGVSADAVAAMPLQGGVPTLALPLPGTAAFFGMRLYLQALVLDPPANLAGLTLSNSLGITIGGR